MFPFHCLAHITPRSEEDFKRKKNKHLAKIHSWVQEHGGSTIIPYSGVFEQTLMDMGTDEEREKCDISVHFL